MDRASHHVTTAGSARLGRCALPACACAALTAAVIAAAPAQGVGKPEFCDPMHRPYVPPTDEEIAEYRDLIIADF